MLDSSALKEVLYLLTGQIYKATHFLIKVEISQHKLSQNSNILTHSIAAGVRLLFQSKTSCQTVNHLLAGWKIKRQITDSSAVWSRVLFQFGTIFPLVLRAASPTPSTSLSSLSLTLLLYDTFICGYISVQAGKVSAFLDWPQTTNCDQLVTSA